ATNTWTVGPSMLLQRSTPGVALGGDGRLYAVGGSDDTFNLRSAEVLDVGCLAPPAGLVSWWAGDGNPEDLYDLNDLTAQNGETFGPGKVSKQLSLDGVDDYFIVRDNGSLNPGTNDFTIEFWINTTDSDRGYIIEKRDGCGMSSFYNVQLRDITGIITLELAQD